jgi:hypothetical protein
MHADPQHDETLLETSATLQASSLWLSEGTDEFARLRNSPAWRILHIFVYGTLLIALAFVLLMWLNWPNRPATLELLFTGLLINALCFLSGINWGVGLRYAAVSWQMPAFQFLWAPLPAYLAWPCMLLPTEWNLLALTALYVWSYSVEYIMWTRAGLMPWLYLRRHASFGMGLNALAGAVCVWTAKLSAA